MLLKVLHNICEKLHDSHVLKVGMNKLMAEKKL